VADAQRSLFDAPVPYRRGSDTSQDAAARLQESACQLRQATLAAYREAGPRGLTPDECAQQLQRSVLAIRPRVTELRQGGLLEFTGERRRNASGMGAKVLRAVR